MLSILDLSAVNTFLKMANKVIDNNNVYFVGYRSVEYNNKIVNARQALLDIGIVKEKRNMGSCKRIKSR